MEQHHMKSGSADIYFIKEQNIIIGVRKQYFRKPLEKLRRETTALMRLPSNHFPKVLSIIEHEHSFTMNYCGPQLTTQNLPSNWREQVKDIIETIESIDIVNGDIDLKNLVVNDGIIVLLDFGNIRMKGEEFFKKHDYETYKTKQHHKLYLICNALAKQQNAEHTLRKYNKEITQFYSK